MGAQLRVYRQKIRSAGTTKKITKAMELISASRIQKAQSRMNSATPYSRAVTRAVSAVASYSNIDHPLLTEAAQPIRAAVVVFTSDRGLAGAFSSQVLREAAELRELLQSEGKEVVHYVVGRKAVQNFSFRQREFEKAWTGNTDQPEFQTAKSLAPRVNKVAVGGFSGRGLNASTGAVAVYNRGLTNQLDLTTTTSISRLNITF